jgi:hypothetical protein
MNIEPDGKWYRFRLRHPVLQILEVRHTVMDNGGIHEEIMLGMPPLQIVELGVQHNYPYRK